MNVKMLDSGTFYGDQFLKWTFSTDFWGTRDYLSQVAAGSLPTSPYNETHWPPPTTKFMALYKQAVATIDEAKRAAIIDEMQQMEYDHGRLHRLVLQQPHGRATRRRCDGLKQGDKGVLPLERASATATGRSGSRYATTVGAGRGRWVATSPGVPRGGDVRIWPLHGDHGLHRPAHAARRADAVPGLDRRVRGDAGAARRSGQRDPRPQRHARAPRRAARAAWTRPARRAASTATG